MSFRFTAMATIVMAFLPVSAFAQSADVPKLGTCITCHGRDGVGTSPVFPNLAGQKSLYMVQQLEQFRSGARKSEVMNVVAKPLTDAEIEALANYYEGLKPSGP
ncbi:cytochrome c [Skermanella aerolata]|uniref:Cytochrome c n=1 Tax=Skermanella aerolata TaxID=393310 RepID=A0A512DSY2_9PROT|nr:cytochrome c [Skermanella aerolata]KJB95999.1 cytochrome C [Skermanella aerolata KACC 11604]GEO39565.1 cytochrome c [Skermanella aerolata]